MLHRCLADALRVKKVQEVELGMDDQNMTAMSHIDDEARLYRAYMPCARSPDWSSWLDMRRPDSFVKSGLLLRALKGSKVDLSLRLEKEKCVFEFVAICTKSLEKGRGAFSTSLHLASNGRLP